MLPHYTRLFGPATTAIPVYRRNRTAKIAAGSTNIYGRGVVAGDTPDDTLWSTTGSAWSASLVLAEKEVQVLGQLLEDSSSQASFILPQIIKPREQFA